ncbi:conserved hypothetical protein [Culex quinquefasciatus]|uniref:Uncharacterized protein n=1 Tax=Culex quinquefasciatus TaxID=7176 RepID=B0X027_CULQU|nr:conserved hypothetical protein [Culex quinquefasciatus]|eukprot:XP_001862999.1 conserved hypothetical protein [Culex quinquefasciatus]
MTTTLRGCKTRQEQEEIQERPQITTLISSLANYSNTIPAPTDPDAKPAPASARMVYTEHLLTQTIIVLEDDMNAL